MVRQGQPDPERQARLRAELRSELEARRAGYRDRALKLFPHICARCGREFSGQRLKELTVHHKDRNHDHNPPDGSNWELLCLYCHDDEHAVDSARTAGDTSAADDVRALPKMADPFAGLDALLGTKPPPGA